MEVMIFIYGFYCYGYIFLFFNIFLAREEPSRKGITKQKLFTPGQALAKHPGVCLISCMHAQVTSVVSESLQPYGLQPTRSSVHGVLQIRILQWVAISTPGDLPNPGFEPTSLTSPALAGGFFTTSATWEAQGCLISGKILKKIIHQAQGPFSLAEELDRNVAF